MSYTAINQNATTFSRGVCIRGGSISSKGFQTLTGNADNADHIHKQSEMTNPFKLPPTPDIPTFRVNGHDSDRGRSPAYKP